MSEHPMNQMLPMDMRHHANVMRKRRFTLEEVGKAMIKSEGITSGHWLVGAEFAHTVAQVGLSQNVGPGMVFMIHKIHLDEIDPKNFKEKGVIINAEASF
jgi:hypothetical protein